MDFHFVISSVYKDGIFKEWSNLRKSKEFMEVNWDHSIDALLPKATDLKTRTGQYHIGVTTTNLL